ncbi:regulation of nuclear pre-mRNA domain-containing protein 1B-like [Pistacia vera]|uniref:regulation of nuclear pre-mRNA domain-containing protein 1B-like n=1 Tax=Pistacia vera TaxID=55513 RepID=UPI001263DA5B|nr:regulation of nuclear pre-mRNA domain-containing protein 1B-like [Pistacia vera]XP_031270451.1 regulation of nuclear pre-mRNA domain-containing protein 1B-like [Pistacia vera]
MSSEAFDGVILAEKLSKLNNSQQSIESLSRWCITHRKKAKQIVETWDKLFNSSQKEQRVSFLYLANDILQNSRRKGSEFVNEFWKVLPVALKHVYDNGDEYGKKAVTRLVDIWEERKVFGSRGQNLKDELLGKNPRPISVSNGKSSNPIKIVKRDVNSLRIKLAVGALPEKIITSFQSVLDESLNEEAALNKCNAAAHHVGKLGEDFENSPAPGNQHGSAVVDQLQEQENVLQQCVGQLESAETSRAALVSQLKEALQDQELKLEFIRARLQVARGQIERASDMRKRLTSPPVPGLPSGNNIPATESAKVVESIIPSIQPTSAPPHSLNQPVLSFAPLKATEEDNKKAAAAAVAAKLAASTSSAQMLTSVLSSLVAEEAASLNGSLNSGGFTAGLSIFPPEKRPKLEKPMAISDVSNSDVGSSTYFSSLQQQPMTNMPVVLSSSMQPMAQSNQMQSPFAPAPPPPPPPPLSPVNPPVSQYVQSAGMMVGVMPYGYGANTLPPPPLLPPHIAMGLGRPGSQSLQPQPQPQPQHSQQQQQQQQQQQPAGGGYYRPPGIGFYGQSQPSTPPVPRQ